MYIFNFNRNEANKMMLEQIQLDPEKELESAMHLLQPKADEKKLFITKHVTLSHPMRLVDPLRFRQSLLNLLSNAIKFTHFCGNVKISISEIC